MSNVYRSSAGVYHKIGTVDGRTQCGVLIDSHVFVESISTVKQRWPEVRPCRRCFPPAKDGQQ